MVDFMLRMMEVRTEGVGVEVIWLVSADTLVVMSWEGSGIRFAR